MLIGCVAFHIRFLKSSMKGRIRKIILINWNLPHLYIHRYSRVQKLHRELKLRKPHKGRIYWRLLTEFETCSTRVSTVTVPGHKAMVKLSGKDDKGVDV